MPKCGICLQEWDGEFAFPVSLGDGVEMTVCPECVIEEDDLVGACERALEDDDLGPDDDWVYVGEGALEEAALGLYE